MTDRHGSIRRQALVAAALDVVAEQGLKGLTHRAVDRQAELPNGSTANLFRNRESLVRGVLEELERRSEELWSAVPAGSLRSADDLARLLATWLVAMLQEPNLGLTRARLTLTLSYPDEVRGGHFRLLTMLESAMAQCRITKIKSRSRSVAAFLDGYLLHYVTVSATERAAARQVLPPLRALLTEGSPA